VVDKHRSPGRIAAVFDRQGAAVWCANCALHVVRLWWCWRLRGCDMSRRVRCDCGWSFEGEDDELIAAVQEHGRTSHGMDVTPEQALAMAEPA